MTQKTADYKPAKEEIRVALRGFLNAVLGNDLLLKIGRCADDGKDGLKDREMYKDADVPPNVIWSGSPQKAAWLEKALIRAAWKQFPKRCTNEQEGGGGIGEDATHHVHLVGWKPTIERLVDIYCALIKRELGDD